MKTSVGGGLAATTVGRKYRFLTTAEYFQMLKTRIGAAGPGDRLTLVTLRLKAEEPAIEELIELLCAASERGADITVLVDAYHILVKEAGEVPGLVTLRKPSSQRVPKFMRRRQDALDRLRQAGVRCEVLNRPARLMVNPFRGRSHIKFTIVNQDVFIGGCNLDDPGYIDAMVTWRDPAIADWLRTLADSFMNTRQVTVSLAGKDLEIPIDAHTRLLIDAGVSEQSVIMDYAYKIIDKAGKHLLITYQFFPHGPVLARLLKAVNRGVKLEAFYNHPLKHHYPYSFIYGLASWQMRRTSPVAFSSNRLPRNQAYLHAKIVANETEAIVSSHNYMIAGVRLGTAEIGLISDSPDFSKDLRKILLRQLDTFSE